ncbi:PAS domain S-box protein, partial [Myxococcota bacterium]|nr:PAS domain S-box protein [Myxococcota bacterium]
MIPPGPTTQPPHDGRLSEFTSAAIIENTLDNIWAVNRSYEILYLNEVFCRAFQSTFGVCLTPGTKILETLPEGIRPAWKERYDRAFQGERFVFIDQIETGGEFFYVEVSVNPIMNQGQAMGAAMFARDITLRIRTEEALAASERRFKELIRNSSDSISIVDGQGCQLSVSDSVEKIVGFTPEELIGLPVIDQLIHPEDRDTAIEAFRRVMTEGSAIARYRHLHKDGSWVWVESHGSNQLENPDIRGIVINARDITRRVRAEQEQASLEAQLQQAQKMEAIGRLAGGVAHDLNNMLGAILGFAELALQAEDRDRLEADLHEIRKAANRSADLTRQLLTFARRQAIVPQVMDLNHSIESLLRMLRRIIGEDIEVVWEPADDLGAVWMDPSQLDQILTNLCVNARDAITAGGRVTIQTTNRTLDEAYCTAHPEVMPGDYAVLTVHDDGCGMDEGTLSRMFEPFFTTKAVGKGTGLGLATVHGIVRQNGGHITVRSAPGEGTTFGIFLPLHVPAEKTQPPPTPVPAPEPSGPGSHTILLVEDEPAILRLTRKML